jgi:hypothetical protein
MAYFYAWAEDEIITSAAWPVKDAPGCPGMGPAGFKKNPNLILPILKQDEVEYVQRAQQFERISKDHPVDVGYLGTLVRQNKTRIGSLNACGGFVEAGHERALRLLVCRLRALASPT